MQQLKYWGMSAQNARAGMYNELELRVQKMKE